MKSFGSLINSLDVVLKLIISTVATYFVGPVEPGEYVHIDFETFLFIYTSMWVGHLVYDFYSFLKENRKKNCE